MLLKKIQIIICEACLNGEGEECHTPGCALFLHRVDIPIGPEMYKVLDSWPHNEPLNSTPENKCWLCGGLNAETKISVERETPNGKPCAPKMVMVHYGCYMDIDP